MRSVFLFSGIDLCTRLFQTTTLCSTSRARGRAWARDLAEETSRKSSSVSISSGVFQNFLSASCFPQDIFCQPGLVQVLQNPVKCCVKQSSPCVYWSALCYSSELSDPVSNNTECTQARKHSCLSENWFRNAFHQKHLPFFGRFEDTFNVFVYLR